MTEPAPDRLQGALKYAAACAAALLALGGACFFLENHPDFSTELDGTQAKGGMLVVQIERFRSEKHRLPFSLGELGVSENPFFYGKRMDDSYVVWYEVRPGESMVYDSKTQEWVKRE